MTVRIGFCGAGNIARYHANSLRGSNADHHIAAVYDPDGERARRFAAEFGAVAVDDAEAVIERSDAVYVVTWTAAHEELVGAVVDAGRALFCEKPLGPDLEAARRISAAVTAGGVVNQVGLVLRRSPVFHALRHLLREPTSGAPMTVIFRDDQFIPTQGRYESTWRGDVALAGSGVLLEHSIHDVDLLEWMFGPVGSVSATSADHHGHEGIEDLAVVRLDFHSGVIGTLVTVWHDVLTRLSNRQVEVFSERLRAQLEGEWLGSVIWERGADDRGVLDGSDLVVRAAEWSPGAGENPDGAFVSAVERGVSATPSVTDALRAHVVVDACYRSAAAGGAVIEVPAD